MIDKAPPRPVMAPAAAYARARAYLAAAPRVPPGNAQIALRAEIATSPAKAAFERSFRDVTQQLSGVGPGAMPPDRDTVLLLIETAMMRFGLRQRAEVWELIGVAPDTGRGLTRIRQRRFTWPLYFALVQVAFAGALQLRVTAQRKG
jgi:hypothetical protein